MGFEAFARLSLVACDGPAVIGWAALSPYSSRQVYAGVAEASVYVGRQHRGRGAGKALLTAIIELTEKRGIWTLQAGDLSRERRQRVDV